MIYAGVDIAKTDHVMGAVDERGAEMCRPMPFKNTEAGLERAVAWLEGLAGSPSGVVVGMEATGLLDCVLLVPRRPGLLGRRDKPHAGKG
ncbi:transposase, partial [uncultured Ellagibacter sp.]|uniref:IS110 family transposase n=1 Tax=uncultured Ellagibacter sp. TaxID=2137580 RepID=UPI00262E7F7C